MARQHESANDPPVSLGTELFNAELLATLSHELRRPLTTIKAYATTLLRHPRRIPREERDECLLAIVTASDRLEQMIERFLEIAQIEAGTLKIERSPVDVARLAQEALLVAEQRASEYLPAHFTFHLHINDAQTVPLILADPRRLREVLDALLENAMNYSAQGGAIEIIVRSVASRLPTGDLRGLVSDAPAPSQKASLKNAPAVARKAGRVLEICVRDHGLGIPAEHLGRIFDHFYRVNTSPIRKVSGLGLGLAMCKYLIELHDGMIWAESDPAGGSTFHIQLPMSEQEEETGPTQTQSA